MVNVQGSILLWYKDLSLSHSKYFVLLMLLPENIAYFLSSLLRDLFHDGLRSVCVANIAVVVDDHCTIGFITFGKTHDGWFASVCTTPWFNVICVHQSRFNILSLQLGHTCCHSSDCTGLTTFSRSLAILWLLISFQDSFNAWLECSVDVVI